MGGPRAFHVMTKPIGPICNLACRYCFYLDKAALYPGEAQWRMPDGVLREYVRQMIEGNDTAEVAFAWQGGEPTLLGVEFFEQACAYQREFAGGKRIENSIQTNGVLLSDEWGQFLRRERFLVGLSLDGPREYHDRFRRDKHDRPTFDAAMAGLEALKRHRVEFNTLTVVSRVNGEDPGGVYRFLKGVGSRYLQFIPLVERESGSGSVSRGGDPDKPFGMTPWSVGPEQFGEFLIGVFNQWIRSDVGSVFVQHFDVALNLWYGRPSPSCVFAETCGTAAALEHNGDVYACDHYVYPEFRLGNLMQTPLAALVGSEQQRAFGAAKRDALPRACRECDVLFACHGECPKHRFALTEEGEPGMNVLCPSYKRFSSHIGPAMREMVLLLRAGRPPAEIMRADPARKVGRNDPCPCGSGKKYKQCCLR